MERKKKILYVITKSVWGGAQKYVYDLATNLPKEQFEVAVITGGNGSLTEKLADSGVRTITLSVLQKSNSFWAVLFAPVNLRAFFALFSIYRKERPDVIHLNSSKIGGLGALAAFFYKTLYPIGYTPNPRVVFTVHGWGFKEPRPRWQKGVLWFFSWLSSLFHNKIITINSADYQSAKRFIPEKKLALILNGIGAIDFLPRKEARAFFAKKIGRPITSDTVIIGTNAELTRNKGLTYLLRSLASCSTKLSFVALIIGEGDDRPNLEHSIITSRLNRCVYLTGFIPDASRYLKGLDIFVLPSLKEGLPYTIMEAVAAGLPVVATRVGGIPDIITHGENGILVTPADHNALGEALTTLSATNRRKALGAAAERSLESRFRLTSMVQRTIALYLS